MSEMQPTNDGMPQRDPQGNLLDVRTTQNPETDKSSETTDPSLLTAEDKPVAAAGELKFEDFKAPEGAELDKATMEKALPVFKDLGLNKDQAQKLVDFYSSISKSAGEDIVNSALTERKEWKDKLTNDPDIGGAKLPQTKATINKALDSILSKADAIAFREAMDYTGAGDHPAFAKAIFKLASLLTETPARDHVNGNGPTKEGQSASGTAARPSIASAIYPNLP
jgi:hypothetical protein